MGVSGVILSDVQDFVGEGRNVASAGQQEVQGIGAAQVKSDFTKNTITAIIGFLPEGQGDA